MQQLNVRITAEQAERLDRYRRETGISKQYLVSKALDALLDKAEQKQRQGAKKGK